jgi:hypothetical protein
MGTNLKDNRQGVENEGADKAPVAHYAPKSKVPASSVSDPHAEAKAGGTGFVGTAKIVAHKGQINTDGWSKSKNR